MSYAQPPQQQPQPHGTQQPPGAPMLYQQVVPVMMVRPSEPKGLSVASMILGIVSVFFGWTFLVPLIGLILGIAGLRREPTGKGFAWTGVILSGLMLLGWLLIVLAVGGSFLALLGFAGTASLSGV